jgi:hypothetical protein
VCRATDEAQSPDIAMSERRPRRLRAARVAESGLRSRPEAFIFRGAPDTTPISRYGWRGAGAAESAGMFPMPVLRSTRKSLMERGMKSCVGAFVSFSTESVLWDS